MNRGFIYAIAHIRGGGELGRQWYETGKYLHKKNTFTDFIAVSEYLIQEGLTTSQKLCIQVGHPSSPELPQCCWISSVTAWHAA